MTNETMTNRTMTNETATNPVIAPAVETATRSEPPLNILDIALQTLTVVVLVATIVAVQARVPCYLYLVAAPILSIGLWACAGLVIDRQALLGQRSSPSSANARR